MQLAAGLIASLLAGHLAKQGAPQTTAGLLAQAKLIAPAQPLQAIMRRKPASRATEEPCARDVRDQAAES